MNNPSLPNTSFQKDGLHNQTLKSRAKTRNRRPRRSKENSDVLVSAVLSTYLLTHLHHVLQRAEYAALKENRNSQAENFSQLRKVLCMDARSMEDASAFGTYEQAIEKAYDSKMRHNVA